LLFNDIFFIEILLLSTVVFYTTSHNLLTLLYTGGLYLILLGLFLLLNDADIYVGFLWIIDLGVGLVFFIFILHFTSFLHQKSQLNLSYRYFFLITNLFCFFILFFYFIPISVSTSAYRDISKTWFFRITHLDYYFISNSYEITELNLLKNSYFFTNSFEFFIVNFSLLFGLISAILMCFMIQRVFNFLNFSQILNLNILNHMDTSFFIKSQNFITQQNTPGVVKIWVKSKSNTY
jgi:hypothetical protein